MKDIESDYRFHFHTYDGVKHACKPFFEEPLTVLKKLKAKQRPYLLKDVESHLSASLSNDCRLDLTRLYPFYDD